MTIILLDQLNRFLQDVMSSSFAGLNNALLQIQVVNDMVGYEPEAPDIVIVSWNGMLG